MDNCYYEKVGNKTTCIDNELPFSIPSKWMWIRLGELGLFRKGPFGSSLTKEMFVDESTLGRVKVYEQKNAIQKDFSLGKYYISKEKFAQMDGFIVNPGDIIVSCAGTIGEIYVLPNNAEIGIINQALMRIRLFVNDILDYFLLYFDFVLKKEANEKGNGTGMKNIPPFDILKKLLVLIPPINEINRILFFLKGINKNIDFITLETTSLNRLVELTKSKILDDIFGENSRYKSYYEKRTKTTLEKLVKSENIGDGDWVLSENMNPNGNIKLVQLKHIGKKVFLNKPFCYVDKDFFTQHSCKEIKEGYLLINRLVSNEMTCCILPQMDEKCITAVDVCWIAPDNHYNLKYLMYYLSSNAFQQQVLMKCSGSTRKRISKTNLIKIELNLHTFDVQERIVKDIENYFNILDKMSNSN